MAARGGVCKQQLLDHHDTNRLAGCVPQPPHSAASGQPQIRDARIVMGATVMASSYPRAAPWLFCNEILTHVGQM